MTRLRISFFLTLTLTSAGRAAEPLSVDDARIKALAGADVKAQQEACRQLIEAGGPAIGALVAAVDRNQPADVKCALQALLGIASREYTENQRKEVSDRLVSELTAKRSVEARRQICRLLSLVGGTECVDPLYKLLVDPDLREMGRWTLIRIPSRSATEALVAGLQITEGDFRVLLVDAIAERADPAAVPVLRSLAIGPDEALSRSALNALSRLPDRVALQTLLEATQAGKPGALKALLTLGEILADHGRKEEVLTAFHTAGKAPTLTAAEYCRVLHGLARFDEPADLETLLTDAADAGKWGRQAAHVRGAALQGLAGVPGQKATDRIAEALAKAAGQAKLDLLEVLGRRGASMTAAAAEALAKAAKADGDPATRAAAIRAIEQARVDAAVQPIIEALPGSAGEVRDAAEQAICRMPGQAMTMQLLREMDKPDLSADLRARILRALGYRGDPGVFDALLKASNDADAAVRAAAFRAMGRLGHAKGVDRLLVAIAQPPGPDRDAAEQALTQLPGEDITARLRAYYDQASGAQKPALLRILARRHAPEVAAVLLKEAKSESADMRAAAATALSQLADPVSEAALVDLAQGGPAEVTRSAVPGLLAIAKKVEGSQPSKASGLYTKAFGLAMSPEQTRAALDGLSRTAGPEDVGMLDNVLPMFGEEDVPVEVSRAAARLAMQLPADRREEATETLEVAAILLDKDAMVPGIVEYLWKIGSDFDPAQLAGYVTCWYLVGPFNLRGDKPASECHLTVAKPDLTAKVTIDGKEFTWKKVHTTNANGAIPLVQALDPGDGLAAYGYAEITVEAATKAQLRIGSDDGIVVWLNGQRVHVVLEDRALTVDQDRVNVELNAGVNCLLVKPLNTFGNWEFSVRLMNVDGEPLPFKQRTE